MLLNLLGIIYVILNHKKPLIFSFMHSLRVFIPYEVEKYRRLLKLCFFTKCNPFNGIINFFEFVDIKVIFEKNKVLLIKLNITRILIIFRLIK